MISIGVNMPSLVDWGRTQPYINLIRQARPWDGNATFDPVTGWPTSDFGTIIATYNADLGGAYLLYAKGNAQISIDDDSYSYITNQSYDSSTNTLSAIVNIQEGTMNLALSFRNTSGPGLQDIVLLQPGYNLTSQFNFTDLLIAHLSRFSLIRFMEWTSTNGNSDRDWNQTTPVDWPMYRYSHHVPWETIPRLTNQFDKPIDIWINIPLNASDDYILHVARIMFNDLNPTNNIYVEYSNELWNFGFVQAHDNNVAANYSVYYEHDPYHFNYDNISNVHTWAFRRTAYQIKHISDLFKTIFGEENVGPWKRVRPILAGQSSQPSVIETGLNYLNSVFGSPSSFLHGIAIAPYFDLDKYRTWSNLTVDQVLDALNTSVRHLLPEQGWSQRHHLGVHATLAAWYNLSVHAYESGPNTVAGCGDCSLEAKIQATHHPRMTDICVSYLKGWYRFGFQTINWYAAGADGISKYGSWTLLEDMRQETRIDTTHMFNTSSPVAQLPRPPPKLKAIDQVIGEGSIQMNFGIVIPSKNFNATNFMNHQVPYPDPDLRHLNDNQTFYYPIKILQSPIGIKLTVYVAGSSGILEAGINNKQQFFQIQTPATTNSTTFVACPIIHLNISQAIVPSVATLRLRIVANGYAIRSFDVEF